eukprot:Skav223472  [mRNA]  locus=scaffold2550:121309:123641:+ [translate_table: standard]
MVAWAAGDIETFKRRRETEIKHGRVAMYATIGFLSPSMGLKFEDVPSAGWTQIVAFAGYYELFVYKYNGTPGAAAARWGHPWGRAARELFVK